MYMIHNLFKEMIQRKVIPKKCFKDYIPFMSICKEKRVLVVLVALLYLLFILINLNIILHPKSKSRKCMLNLNDYIYTCMYTKDNQNSMDFFDKCKTNNRIEYQL